MKEKTKEKKPRSVASIIVNVVFIAALTLLAVAVFTAIKYKKNPDDAYLFGIKPIYIQTGSMEPTLQTGSIAIVKKATFSDFEVNDIVVFIKDEKLITHRVMQVGDGYLKTKGDNNKIFDNFSVYPEEIRAKVIFPINIIATIGKEIKTPRGIFKWIVFPILCVVITIITIKVIKKIAASGEDEKVEELTEEKKDTLLLTDMFPSDGSEDELDESIYFSDDETTEEELPKEQGPLAPDDIFEDDTPLDIFEENQNISNGAAYTTEDDDEQDNISQEDLEEFLEKEYLEESQVTPPFNNIKGSRHYPKVEVIREKKEKKKKAPKPQKKPRPDDDNNEQIYITSKREMEDWRCN